MNHNNFGCGSYRNLFEYSLSAMLVVQPETGIILAANQSACDYYQYSRAQLTEMNIGDINILSGIHIRAEMQNAAKYRKNCFCFRHRLANGEIRDVNVFSSPIVIHHEKVLYSIIHEASDPAPTRKPAVAEKAILPTGHGSNPPAMPLSDKPLPICASCKKIRNDQDFWEQMEGYFRRHAGVEFSHGICPDCLKKLYPEFL